MYHTDDAPAPQPDPRRRAGRDQADTTAPFLVDMDLMADPEVVACIIVAAGKFLGDFSVCLYNASIKLPDGKRRRRLINAADRLQELGFALMSNGDPVTYGGRE